MDTILLVLALPKGIVSEPPPRTAILNLQQICLPAGVYNLQLPAISKILPANYLTFINHLEQNAERKMKLKNSIQLNHFGLWY
ncbi:MAG TPA: hypothetical protein VF870_13925 [Ignavibacteriaceae bacterium]